MTMPSDKPRVVKMPIDYSMRIHKKILIASILSRRANKALHGIHTIVRF